MHAYLAETFRFQPELQVPFISVSIWLKKSLAARRARLARSRLVGELSRLDHQILKDVGIEVAPLREHRPNLSGSSPYMAAIKTFSNTTHLSFK